MIKALSEDLRNKISAGEVVERPSSVVKELIENSLDAGSSEISIVIEKGGHHTIQVRDNGSGISPDDLPSSIKGSTLARLRLWMIYFLLTLLAFEEKLYQALRQYRKCQFCQVMETGKAQSYLF